MTPLPPAPAPEGGHRRKTLRRLAIGAALVALVGTGILATNTRRDGAATPASDPPTGEPQVAISPDVDDDDASRPETPGELWRRQTPPTSRQVSVLALKVIPDSNEMDEKLDNVQIAPLLRRLKPGDGFRYVDNRSERLTKGESVVCDLGGGTHARAELLDPLDAKNKVEFRFTLELAGRPPYSTVIRTPANQIFFCEKELPDGNHLLIGIGAR